MNSDEDIFHENEMNFWKLILTIVCFQTWTASQQSRQTQKVTWATWCSSPVASGACRSPASCGHATTNHYLTTASACHHLGFHGVASVWAWLLSFYVNLSSKFASRLEQSTGTILYISFIRFWEVLTFSLLIIYLISCRSILVLRKSVSTGVLWSRLGIVMV